MKTQSRRPRGGPRSAPILIWLTPEEREAFKRAASGAGIGVGPWLRMLGLREVAPPPRSV
jgi:hypothetical protein